MNPARFLTAIFCDDIRREEGNKLSYLGVYGGKLGLPAFPSVLPRLCFALTMTAPAKTPPAQLQFRIYKDDEIIAQSELTRETLLAAQPDNPADDQWVRYVAFFQIFPVQFTAPCFFRARAICDDEEYRGGSLQVVDQASLTSPVTPR